MGEKLAKLMKDSGQLALDGRAVACFPDPPEAPIGAICLESCRASFSDSSLIPLKRVFGGSGFCPIPLDPKVCLAPPFHPE